MTNKAPENNEGKLKKTWNIAKYMFQRGPVGPLWLNRRAIRKQAKTDISKLKGIRNNLRSTIQRHNQMANPEALDIEEAVENNKRMIEEAVEHGSLLSVVTSNLEQSDLGNDGSGFEAYEQALDEVKSILQKITSSDYTHLKRNGDPQVVAEKIDTLMLKATTDENSHREEADLRRSSNSQSEEQIDMQEEAKEDAEIFNQTVNSFVEISEESFDPNEYQDLIQATIEFLKEIQSKDYSSEHSTGNTESIDSQIADLIVILSKIFDTIDIERIKEEESEKINLEAQTKKEEIDAMRVEAAADANSLNEILRDLDSCSKLADASAGDTISDRQSLHINKLKEELTQIAAKEYCGTNGDVQLETQINTLISSIESGPSMPNDSIELYASSVQAVISKLRNLEIQIPEDVVIEKQQTTDISNVINAIKSIGTDMNSLEFKDLSKGKNAPTTLGGNEFTQSLRNLASVLGNLQAPEIKGGSHATQSNLDKTKVTGSIATDYKSFRDNLNKLFIDIQARKNNDFWLNFDTKIFSGDGTETEMPVIKLLRKINTEAKKIDSKPGDEEHIITVENIESIPVDIEALLDGMENQLKEFDKEVKKYEKAKVSPTRKFISGIIGTTRAAIAGATLFVVGANYIPNLETEDSPDSQSATSSSTTTNSTPPSNSVSAQEDPEEGKRGKHQQEFEDFMKMIQDADSVELN